MQLFHILLSGYLRKTKLAAEAEIHGLAANAVEDAFIKNSDHTFDLMDELQEPGVHDALVEWMIVYNKGTDDLSLESHKLMNAFVSNDSTSLLKDTICYINSEIKK